MAIYEPSSVSAGMSTVTKLVLSAEYYAGVNPSLSRFCMLEAERIKAAASASQLIDVAPSKPSLICPRCCVVRRPENTTTRLLPRMKPSQQLCALASRRTAGVTGIGKSVQEILELYEGGLNRMTIKCGDCGKTVIVPCAGRPAPRPGRVVQPTAATVKPVNRNTEKKKKKRRKKNSLASIDGIETTVDGPSGTVSGPCRTLPLTPLLKTTQQTSTACLNTVPATMMMKTPSVEQSYGISTPRQMRQLCATTPLSVGVKPSDGGSSSSCGPRSTNKKSMVNQKHNILKNILRQQQKAAKDAASSPSTNLQHFLALL